MPVETDAGLRELLGLERVAVVGCSSTPGKDAHEVPKYLLEHGYDVVPVNPTADEVLGRPAHDSLSAAPDGVELVNVFRPSPEVSGIVDEALDREDVAAVWTQLDVRDDAAAERAEAGGLQVVQDRCMKVEHRRLR